MQPKKVSDEASIVLTGSLNPAIFHPEWLLRHQLIKEEEGKEAKVEIVMNDVSIVRLPWAVTEVVRERYLARTNDESHFAPLRDLVIGTFRLLEHTPIKQIGLNRHIGFEMENADTWHNLGHFLAPKEYWRARLKDPGLLQLSIRGHTGDPDHQVNVTIRPATAHPPTVQIEVNNHYVLAETKFEHATTLVQDRWDVDLSFCAELAEGLMAEALGAIK